MTCSLPNRYPRARVIRWRCPSRATTPTDFDDDYTETGLYVDLSDAFLAQTIRPRIPPEGRRVTPDEAAIEEIARRVVELLDDRTAGHCVRVSDLPLRLADGACAPRLGWCNRPMLCASLLRHQRSRGMPSQRRSWSSAICSSEASRWGGS